MHPIELTNKALDGATYNWQNMTPAKVSWQQLARRKDEQAPYAYKES